MIASYVGENKEFERQVLAGELELQLTPQGTLAEKLRAGGAGIPGFYTRTAFGTKLAEGKETHGVRRPGVRARGGDPADLSIVKAWKGDKSGNLVYRKTSRNFNPMIATCGKVTVAEVEELVEVGELDPDQIHTPGIYVDRIIQGASYEKRIEFRTVSGGAASKKDSPIRDLMARRAAQELRDGYYVNLGIGIPTLVANFIPQDITSRCNRRTACSASGLSPPRTRSIPTSSTPASRPSPRLPGSSFFSSADSFAMIRGGHIDLSILGALEVAENGDLANWMVPGKMVKGPGGAMDLVSGVRRVIVLMEHTAKDGAPKILKALHAAGHRQGRGQHDHHRPVRVRGRRRQGAGADRAASRRHPRRRARQDRRRFQRRAALALPLSPQTLYMPDSSVRRRLRASPSGCSAADP